MQYNAVAVVEPSARADGSRTKAVGDILQVKPANQLGEVFYLGSGIISDALNGLLIYTGIWLIALIAIRGDNGLLPLFIWVSILALVPAFLAWRQGGSFLKWSIIGTTFWILVANSL